MFGRRTTILLPVVAAMAISACSASATAGPTAKPTVAPTVARTPHNNAVPQSLQGKYTATIGGSSVSPGAWPMVVGQTSIMVTNPNPGAQPFSVGLIDVNADRLTFGGDAECTPGQPDREGVYTYTLTNGELKFTAVDDLCMGRRDLLTAAAWLRQ